MKNPLGFIEGVGVALLFSMTGAAIFMMFNPFMSAGILMRLVISGLGFAYVLYLLWRSRERFGRVTVLTIWLLTSIIIWVFYPPILVYIILHLGMLWLIRSLYFYSGVLPALLDLGLNAIALLLAIGAGLHTESLFIGLWSLFLCQALFVFIPATFQRKTASAVSNDTPEDRFESAHRVAVAALRKLSTV
jgi:hypothetical protein